MEKESNYTEDVFTNMVNKRNKDLKIKEVEDITKKHHESNKTEPKLEQPKLTKLEIDFDGKAHHNAKKGVMKMTRVNFLKLLGAVALAGVSYKALESVSKPIINTITSEGDFAKTMQETSDLISDIIDMDPAFEANPNFVVETDEHGKINIKSSDKKGYDDLKKYLMDYSKDESGKGLSTDQAIYAISLCGDTSGLYEAYYNLSRPQFMEHYFKGPGSEVNGSAYQNYMQSGKSVRTGAITGIDYADGIHNLEENIYNLDLTEGNGKAL